MPLPQSVTPPPSSVHSKSASREVKRAGADVRGAVDGEGGRGRVREREEGNEGERMRMMLNPYLNFLKQS